MLQGPLSRRLMTDDEWDEFVASLPQDAALLVGRVVEINPFGLGESLTTETHYGYLTVSEGLSIAVAIIEAVTGFECAPNLEAALLCLRRAQVIMQ